MTKEWIDRDCLSLEVTSLLSYPPISPLSPCFLSTSNPLPPRSLCVSFLFLHSLISLISPPPFLYRQRPLGIRLTCCASLHQCTSFSLSGIFIARYLHLMGTSENRWRYLSSQTGFHMVHVDGGRPSIASVTARSASPRIEARERTMTCRSTTGREIAPRASSGCILRYIYAIYPCDRDFQTSSSTPR